MLDIIVMLMILLLFYIIYLLGEKSWEKDYNNLIDENDNLVDENTALRKELERIKFYLSKI